MSVFHRVEDQCQYPVNCCGSTPYRNLLTEGSINSINFLGFKLPIKFTYHAVSVVRAECLGVDFGKESLFGFQDSAGSTVPRLTVDTAKAAFCSHTDRRVQYLKRILLQSQN